MAKSYYGKSIPGQATYAKASQLPTANKAICRENYLEILSLQKEEYAGGSHTHQAPRVFHGSWYDMPTHMQLPYITPRASLARRLVSLVVFGTLLQGCFSARLSSFTPPSHLSELAESAAIQIPMFVTNNTEEQSHGFQFLLGFLPVTRIFPDSLSEMVAAKMVTHAGFRNFGLVARAPETLAAPRVETFVEDVQINGYDLLVTRRPSASVSLRAVLHTREGLLRECHGNGSYAEFSRFAFERDLEHALEEAVDLAAQQAITCLLDHISAEITQSGAVL
jgi:hypothetical protein